MKVVENIYEDSVVAVRYVLGKMNGFKVEVGLHQGSVCNDDGHIDEQGQAGVSMIMRMALLSIVNTRRRRGRFLFDRNEWISVKQDYKYMDGKGWNAAVSWNSDG